MVRYFKQKFEPDWQPRYMGYQSAWEFPFATACVAALIAGGWAQMFSAGSESTPAPQAPQSTVAAADP